MANPYVGVVDVVCPDGQTRVADVHYSPLYGRDRASVRFQGKRVTGDIVATDAVGLYFVPDPFLQNGGAFNHYAR